MRKLFIILSVLIAAAGCGDEMKVEIEVPDSEALVITHIDNGDTISFTKSAIIQFNQYFNMDADKIPPPYELIKLAEGDNQMAVLYSSEAGIDNFHYLYSYILRKNKKLEPYRLLKDDLLKIYRKINSLYSAIDYGGTYYGHQYCRAQGIAEYWMYQKKEKKVPTFDFFIKQDCQPFMDSLRSNVKTFIESDNYLYTDELKQERIKELQTHIDDLDALFGSYFHLDRAQEYQKKYYTLNNNIDSITPWEIEVNNFKFSITDLYGFWNHSDDPEEAEPVFEIDKDGFHLLQGPTKQYIINYDSIKISESHHGKYSVGQITKLTEDSLIIEWNTNDINRYRKSK